MQNPLDTLRQKSESGDRRAVSPVIGVILMVAITVILAAVIATFVLGLGEQVSDTTPNANFQADFEPDNTSDFIVEIQHNSGDDIELTNIRAQISGDAELNGTDFSGAISGDTFSAGDSFTIAANQSDNGDLSIGTSTLNEGDEIELVFSSGDGSGSILRAFEVPRNYDTSGQ